MVKNGGKEGREERRRHRHTVGDGASPVLLVFCFWRVCGFICSPPPPPTTTTTAQGEGKQKSADFPATPISGRAPPLPPGRRVRGRRGRQVPLHGGQRFRAPQELGDAPQAGHACGPVERGQLRE